MILSAGSVGRGAVSVRVALALILFLVPLLLASGCLAGWDQPRPELVIFAASSTAEFLGEAGESFGRRRPGVKLTFNFAGSHQLRTQLEQGAEADIFVSADETNLERAGDLVADVRTLVRNRLVVIVPKGNPAGIGRLEDLARPHRLVVGAPEVPAGRYAREIIRRAETSLGSGFASRVLENRVSEEPNVKQIVSKVALGEADAGIVYATDITAAVAPRVLVLEVPEAWNVRAAYPMGRVKNGRQPELAAEFMDFLLSAEARRIFERYGFLPAGRP